MTLTQELHPKQSVWKGGFLFSCRLRKEWLYSGVGQNSAVEPSKTSGYLAWFQNPYTTIPCLKKQRYHHTGVHRSSSQLGHWFQRSLNSLVTSSRQADTFTASREKRILWWKTLSLELEAYGLEKIQLPKPVGRAGPVCKWMAVMWEKLQNKTKIRRAFHYKRYAKHSKKEPIPTRVNWNLVACLPSFSSVLGPSLRTMFPSLASRLQYFPMDYLQNSYGAPVTQQKGKHPSPSMPQLSPLCHSTSPFFSDSSSHR